MSRQKRARIWLTGVLGGCVLLASLGLLGACGEDAGSTGDRAGEWLIRVAEEPAGENCAQGGQQIQLGSDRDGDGLLGAEEVTSTSYVCDGESAHETLFRMEPEPEGDNCPHGGQALLWGPDENENGALDPEEVAQTEYLCNGRPGSGLNSLASVTDEAPGANCEHGGQAIRLGLDENGDGLLQPAEVDTVSYVCHGAAGSSSLVRQEDEPEGANCPFGGRSVLSGLDLDGDGYLDIDEVEATSYVCNGEPGVPGAFSLFEVTDEPAGVNCSSGGLRIESGLDTNANAVLDATEIQAERYVCNGADGADGTDGTASLVSVTPEPPGTSCTEGGQKIESGLDTDGDGTLDASEVSTTSYVCHGADGADGTNGTDGADGAASLVSVTPEPPGASCTEGGQRIESGLDVNGNGTLDATEVSTTSYVCDGADGADGTDGSASLVSVTPEPPGASCTEGGQKIESGLDTDGDGALDTGEVTSTSYVCNGADGIDGTNGTDGADGAASLVSVTPESPGTSCTSGGQRIESGLDVNGNGTLDATEVSTTSYVCDGAARLVEATNAQWGGVCLKGGVKITTGIDANADGILDPAEVDHTDYVCNLYPVHIDAGRFHTCAVISDGSVRCWGDNGLGQLGDGTMTRRTMAVDVVYLSGVVSISAGWDYTCALRITGTVFCWGGNMHDELGDGSNWDYRLAPVQVIGLTNATDISAGSSHVCAIQSDMTVMCWGGSIATPYSVSGLAGVTAISAGSWHTCAVKADGTAWCWDTNSSPVAVNGVSDAVAIAAGQDHDCSLHSDGTARCWGSNSYGELGDGSTVDSATPVDVLGLSGASSISVGWHHTCAGLLDGTVECWGLNGYGQLGDGTTTDRYSPVPVSGLSGATSISAGIYHTCSVLSDGTARCWGYNGYGQLGDGTLTNRLEPVISY